MRNYHPPAENSPQTVPKGNFSPQTGEEALASNPLIKAEKTRAYNFLDFNILDSYLHVRRTSSQENVFRMPVNRKHSGSNWFFQVL